MSDPAHVIIGTAGHVDHGKTALVKALTGIDADTLPEEKKRGLTIELGFVFLESPDFEKQIVFIDVPGHEKFIKTMVAGASHIDAAVLVVAADEGIGAQTREHLEILQLLGVTKGLIALTKCDLIDRERLEETITAVRSFVSQTFLSDVPVIPVSSVTGSGLGEFKARLIAMADSVAAREEGGFFRMPIDRVFTMKGFGTVIAGTILSGEVRIGDRIQIYPEGMTARIRGIQVHERSRESSSTGKRTALNLQDIKKENLYRGQSAAAPGTLTPSYRLDTELMLLKSCAKGLKNRTRVRLHVGTDEKIGRVILLDRDVLSPGESGLVQFVLDSPAVTTPGDRFVIRTFSPVASIGGGRILDARPQRHKRMDEATVKGLRMLAGDVPQKVEQMIFNSAFHSIGPEEISVGLGILEQDTRSHLSRLLRRGRIVEIEPPPNDRYLHVERFLKLESKTIELMLEYYRDSPYELEIPYSVLRGKMLNPTEARIFKLLLEGLQAKGKIEIRESHVRLAGYKAEMRPSEEKAADRIEAAFRKAGLVSPLPEQVREEFGLSPAKFENIMKILAARGRIFRLSPKVVYHQETLKKAEEMVIDFIQKHGSMSMAELRDLGGFSRKYAQAILEYFNQTGSTKRVGDRHFRANKPE